MGGNAEINYQASERLGIISQEEAGQGNVQEILPLLHNNIGVCASIGINSVPFKRSCHCFATIVVEI